MTGFSEELSCEPFMQEAIFSPEVACDGEPLIDHLTVACCLVVGSSVDCVWDK